jgi:hypothetical protein
MRTLKEMQRRHRALWEWLAKHPSNSKREWPGWTRNGGPYWSGILDCFACQWVEDNRVSHDCGEIDEPNTCPLVWEGSNGCMDDDSYFQKWKRARSPRTRTKYAWLISKLKLRKR